MSDPDDRALDATALNGVLLPATPLAQILEHVAQLAARQIEHCAFADVTSQHGEPHTTTDRGRDIRSTLSVPLDASGDGTEVLGALNLYSELPDAFDADAVAATERLAQQAAIVIANAQAFWGAQQQAEQLQEALQSRAVIEQAKGVLMARSGVTPEGAFRLLVLASQRENRKVRLIATEIVERTQEQTPRRQPRSGADVGRQV